MSYTNPPYYISAYALAQKRGFTGTLDEWLESLTAFYLAKQAGYTGTVQEWVRKLNDPVPKIKIGKVQTLDGGMMATVEIEGTPEEPELSFGIPRGIGMNDALPLIGGIMKGSVNMNSFRILGLPEPKDENEAVSKSYMESYVKSYAATMEMGMVTLIPSDWKDNSQTVAVKKVLADPNKQAIITTATPGSLEIYLDCNIKLNEQGAGTLTFICDDVPSASVAINVLILTKGDSG